MVYRKKYSRRSGKYSRRRRKWTQQLLAVGTVAKIAKKVASKLDRANDKFHLYTSYKLATAAQGDPPIVWPDGALGLPAASAYRPGHGIETDTISLIGGLVQDVTGSILTGTQQKGVQIRMQGLQSRFVIQNRNTVSCRVTAMLLFIPNVNQQTSDGVDFLRPDIYMLGKVGTGNLQYDGWNKQELNVHASSAAGPRKYTILDKKHFTLGPTRASGQQETSAGQTRPIPAIQTKHFMLSKYFKGAGKKHFIKYEGANGRMLNDGNYFFVLWSDLPAGLAYHYCAYSQVRFKVLQSQFAVNGPSVPP